MTYLFNPSPYLSIRLPFSFFLQTTLRAPVRWTGLFLDLRKNRYVVLRKILAFKRSKDILGLISRVRVDLGLREHTHQREFRTGFYKSGKSEARAAGKTCMRKRIGRFQTEDRR